MRLYKPKIPAVLVILGTLGIVFLQSQGAKPMDTSSRDQANPLPLIEYLAQLGEEYNYFFTVEVASEDTDVKQAIVSHWVQRRKGKKNLQHELEQLRESIPNLAYEFDESNPRIIHIMDARLKQHTGYALEASSRTSTSQGESTTYQQRSVNREFP